MKDVIKKILLEEINKHQYQIRDIGGDTYYKKLKSDSDWVFTTKDDFEKNSNSGNVVKWKEKKLVKQPYVRQKEVPATMKEGKLDYLMGYYENVSPNDYIIKNDGEDIIIKLKK